jgi:hypothetical protein
MVTPLPVAPRKVSERRLSPRCPRNIRVIVLSDDCALDEPFGAWIMDTSRGGVRLRVQGDTFPIGTRLLIKGPFASDRVPWTALCVKHSRTTGAHHEIGCEFVRSDLGDTADMPSPLFTRLDRS